MSREIRKLIPITVLLASTLASLFFVGRKTVSFNNNSNQEVVAVANIADRAENTISILFVGDIMLDRYIRQTSEIHGHDFPFQKMESALRNNDLVVGNLEGPITDNKSVSLYSKVGEKNNYIFTFDPKFAQALADKNIKLVNIGNNHIANFGSSGIESTRNYLVQAGIDFFGDPEKSNFRMVIKNIKALELAFVNYNQFVPNAAQKAIDDIDRAKNYKANMIIVYAHWGKEFVDQPDQNIKDLAHKFIDAGADLIIGSHPHVIQTKEEYRSKAIYYSLGNFIFDQYFNSDTQRGLAVQAEIDLANNKIDYREYFVKMESSGQTILNMN
jgi:poly-gamma-glutamate synthesis protein (capsule biosynthesis protein)